MSLLERERAALVVVDVQEGFRSYATFDAVSAACGRLVEGARILGVPIVATAQYPKGLGPVAPEVGLRDEQPVEKTVFSAVRADGFDLDGPRPGGRLRHRGAHLRLPDRARPARRVASRCTSRATRSARAHPGDLDVGLEQMERAGALSSSVETALFELLRARRARTSSRPSRGDQVTPTLLLEDGTRFDGDAVGAERE